MGVRTTCRICLSGALEIFFDFGRMPLANGFIRPEHRDRREQTYPLQVARCGYCGGVQLTEVVPPESIFTDDYPYLSSVTNTMRAHFAKAAADLVERFQIGRTDLVIDIGSNDGTFLEQFQKYGLPVFGVEPSPTLAQIARQKGIPTIADYFTPTVAKRLRSVLGRARLITATNVLAHIDDLDTFFEAINMLMDDEGILVVEFPALFDLLKNTAYDTIYHEHLSYFALHPLLRLLQRSKFSLVDLEQYPVHGGSVRLFIQKSPRNNSPALRKYLVKEQRAGLRTQKPFAAFAKHVQQKKEQLLARVHATKKQGKRLVGYGASARGNTLLNYCKIHNDVLDYIIDATPTKQGRLTPGTHIPVYHESKVEAERPDFFLLLAWNYKDEILAKNEAFRSAGGKFLIPLPRVSMA